MNETRAMPGAPRRPGKAPFLWGLVWLLVAALFAWTAALALAT